MIDKFIQGKPKAQPRPRIRRIGYAARIYNPSTADKWKKAIAYQLIPYHNKKFDGYFHVELNFFFERPKTHFGSGKKTLDVVKKSSPKFHTYKPDLDNLAKSVLDTLTDISYWIDDSNITELLVTKDWANSGQLEGMQLKIQNYE